MTNKNDDRKNKKEKLHDFKNWPQWANFTQAMLEEIEVWDVVDESRADPITTAQTRRKEKDNAVASKIIEQEVNGNFYINIIREKNSQRSWKTLCQSLLVRWPRSSILYPQRIAKLL